MAISPLSTKTEHYVPTPYDKIFVVKKKDLDRLTVSPQEFESMSKMEMVWRTTVHPVAKGAIIGTSIGATTGAVLGASGTLGLGALPGGAVGGFIGFLVGTTTGCIYMVFSNNNLKVWKAKYKETEFIEIFKNLHNEIPSLEEFLCPLSLLVMENPVIDKYGNTYEKDMIIKWIKTNKEANMNSPDSRRHNLPAIDPKKNGPLEIADLQPDARMSARIMFAYKKILEGEMGNPEIAPQVKEGLNAAIKMYDHKVKAYYEKHVFYLVEEMSKGKITPLKFASDIQKLTNDLHLPFEKLSIPDLNNNNR